MLRHGIAGDLDGGGEEEFVFWGGVDELVEGV